MSPEFVVGSAFNEHKSADSLIELGFVTTSRLVFTNFWQRKLSWREQSVRSLDAELTAA